MKRTRLRTNIGRVVFVLGCLYIWHAAPNSMVWAGLKAKFVDATKGLDVREGDFVFQNVPGKLFRVIEDVTGSPVTHCGIIVKKDDGFYVLEAIGPVKLTPLNAWIHRGVGSQFVIVRFKEPYRAHIPEVLQASARYLNKPYDIQYEWDDEKIYCSELIYKAVKEATGIQLAEFRRLGDMNWQPHEAFIRVIAAGKLPLDRAMVVPGDLVKSEYMEPVFDNLKGENYESGVRYPID